MNALTGRRGAVSSMSPVEFRDALRRLDMSQAGFALFLKRHGDQRAMPTIIRAVAEVARLDRTTPAPWALVVLMNVMLDRARVR